MSIPRYFVDERIGCIAVRDRTLTNKDDKGLWGDTPGVIRFWMGYRDYNGEGNWYIFDNDRQAANDLCNELNRIKS